MRGSIKKIVSMVVVILFLYYVRPASIPEMWQVGLITIGLYEALQIGPERGEKDEEQGGISCGNHKGIYRPERCG